MRRTTFSSLLLTLALVGPARGQEDPALRRAREILRQAPLVDGHNDTPSLILEHAKGDVGAYDLRRRAPHETDLARLREGQVAAQFWSVWIPSVEAGSARLQLEQIDVARRMIAAYPEALVFATRADDIEAAHRAGKIASFLGGENGRALENSLGALRAYYDLGMRYVTLTHGRGTDWADSATDEARHGGLTPFGREVVREMNRLGMLVDISHVSPAVMHQVLDLSEAPVVFSHSSARALTDHPRNVPDDVLARLGKNGGVVMVTWVPPFVSTKVMQWGGPLELKMQGAKTIADIQHLLAEREAERGPAPKATLSDVADHVEHAARVAGVDHVGLGADFAGMGGPVGLEDVSRYPHLFAELVRRGWRERGPEEARRAEPDSGHARGRGGSGAAAEGTAAVHRRLPGARRAEVDLRPRETSHDERVLVQRLRPDRVPKSARSGRSGVGPDGAGITWTASRRPTTSGRPRRGRAWPCRPWA